MNERPNDGKERANTLLLPPASPCDKHKSITCLLFTTSLERTFVKHQLKWFRSLSILSACFKYAMKY